MREFKHPAAYASFLLGICFLTRIFYAGYVWADEGLWFTAAQELVRGRELYSEIWFDKPPAVAWVYAALFALTGPSVMAVRLFTILYAFAVSLALWQMGRRFWGEEEGRLAALLYAIYNATYIHSQVQPMAVDQLVLLPYLYSGYLFLTGRDSWAGLLAGVAFSINPKAGALLLFFGIAGIMSARFRLADRPVRWAALAGAFGAALAPWAVYLLTGEKWRWYIRDFWEWGFRYVTVYSPLEAIANGLRRTLNYAGFHAALVIGAAGLALWGRGAVAAEREKEGRRKAEPGHALWLWLGISFLGVAAGGRFFPRYFYQVLPLLCLVAARGYVVAKERFGRAEEAGEARSGRATRAPRSAFQLLFWGALLFAIVRFHHRGVVLAYEWATGRQTQFMAAWRDAAMDRDSRLIASRLERRPPGNDINRAMPRFEGPSLFVWGYRPEIYFYCGCPAASAYLSSQPLTGVPADIHLRESRSVAPERAAENRARLLAELRSAPPDYIVDGLGPYNPELLMEKYPELAAFLNGRYRRVETVGNGVIYQLRE